MDNQSKSHKQTKIVECEQNPTTHPVETQFKTRVCGQCGVIKKSLRRNPVQKSPVGSCTTDRTPNGKTCVRTHARPSVRLCVRECGEEKKKRTRKKDCANNHGRTTANSWRQWERGRMPMLFSIHVRVTMPSPLCAQQACRRDSAK